MKIRNKFSIFLFIFNNAIYPLDYLVKLKDEASEYISQQNLIKQGSSFITQGIKNLQKTGSGVVNEMEQGSSFISEGFKNLQSTGSGIVTEMENLYDQASQLKSDIKTKLKTPLYNYFNKNNPYSTQVATIRKSSSLPKDEIQVVNNRLLTNNAALENIIGEQIPNYNNLRIAFCASGGGYRALTSTLGSLKGAQEINLLNAVTYMAGLSGGAWAFATWLSSNKNIDLFMNMIKTNLDINKKLKDISVPHVDNSQITNILNNLFSIYIFDLPLSSVNLWGAIITDNLLNPIANRHKLTLTDQQKNLASGTKPFPIYTAIEPLTAFKYNWYEFTPFEIGNITTNVYTPTWGFGRRFLNGNSILNSPEFPLDFYLGVFGSAYTVSPDELEDKLQLKSKVVKYINEKFPQLSVETLNKMLDLRTFFNDLENYHIPISKALSTRFIPAEVANPHFGVQGDNKKDIVLVDAGIDFNLPLPPLLRPERKIDIIFVLDASGNVFGGEELVRAEKFARENKLKFPKIDYSQINDLAVNIFGLNDKDPEVPLIIYMPRINPLLKMSEAERQKLKTKLGRYERTLIDKLKTFDPDQCTSSSFCSTYNFAYSKEQFDLLSQMTYLNMLVNKDKIYNAIKEKYYKKFKKIK